MNDRDVTLPRNPNLWHSLPAAKQYEIENRQDWLELEEKMAALKLEPDMDTLCRDSEHLYAARCNVTLSTQEPRPRVLLRLSFRHVTVVAVP